MASLLLLFAVWVVLWNYNTAFQWGWGWCGSQDAVFHCVWIADVEVVPGVNARQEAKSNGWFSVPNATSAWSCQRRFGGPAGIFVWPRYDSDDFWRQASVPIWLPWLVVALPTGFLFLIDRPRFPQGHCQRCGYNLTGNVSGRCSECGISTDYQPPFTAVVCRLLKWGGVAAAIFILMAATAFWRYARSPGSPTIILAVGFEDGSHFMQPLSQRPVGLWSKVFRARNYRNWSGDYLYVSGKCPECWKPGARTGAFVVAKLPTGLAYATYDASASGHAHLTMPRPISPAIILPVGVSLAGFTVLISWLLQRAIWRISRGRRPSPTNRRSDNSA